MHPPTHTHLRSTHSNNPFLKKKKKKINSTQTTKTRFYHYSGNIKKTSARMNSTAIQLCKDRSNQSTKQGCTEIYSVHTLFIWQKANSPGLIWNTKWPFFRSGIKMNLTMSNWKWLLCYELLFWDMRCALRLRWIPSEFVEALRY